MDPYIRLANAIIIQAGKDYVAALKKLKNGRRNTDAEAEIKSIERFFRSDYYSMLTDVDPEFLIRKLREEV